MVDPRNVNLHPNQAHLRAHCPSAIYSKVSPTGPILVDIIILAGRRGM